MKKLTLGFLISISTLTACKKSYTCNCVSAGGTSTFTIKSSTQADASNQCVSHNISGSGSMPNNSTTCALQ